MKQELVQSALKQIENPQILINMVSLRVRQLGQGFRPLIPVTPRMTFMDVALKEISEGKLSFEALEAEEPEATA
jgi:DNA-directed RNA polymerase subunit omega